MMSRNDNYKTVKAYAIFLKRAFPELTLKLDNMIRVFVNLALFALSTSAATVSQRNSSEKCRSVSSFTEKTFYVGGDYNKTATETIADAVVQEATRDFLNGTSSSIAYVIDDQYASLAREYCSNLVLAHTAVGNDQHLNLIPTLRRRHYSAGIRSIRREREPPGPK